MTKAKIIVWITVSSIYMIYYIISMNDVITPLTLQNELSTSYDQTHVHHDMINKTNTTTWKDQSVQLSNITNNSTNDVVSTKTEEVKNSLEQSENDTSMKLFVSAILRDQAPYLQEWIEYHIMIGVDKIYLANDRRSVDDSQCIIDAYVEAGFVEDIGSNNPDYLEQTDIYENARKIIKASYPHAWLLVHDVDEFLSYNTDKYNNVKEAIMDLSHNFPRVEAISIPRLIFGSSGNQFHENGLVIERFTKRYDPKGCFKNDKYDRTLFNQNHIVSYCKSKKRSKYGKFDNGPKPLYKVNKVDTMTMPHRVRLFGMKGSTLEDVQRDKRYMNNFHTVSEFMWINHYQTKSLQEFLYFQCHNQYVEKFLRCKSCNPDTFFEIHSSYANNYMDDSLSKNHLQELKKRLEVSLSREIATECVSGIPSYPSFESMRGCWNSLMKGNN